MLLWAFARQMRETPSWAWRLDVTRALYLSLAVGGCASPFSRERRRPASRVCVCRLRARWVRVSLCLSFSLALSIFVPRARPASGVRAGAGRHEPEPHTESRRTARARSRPIRLDSNRARSTRLRCNRARSTRLFVLGATAQDIRESRDGFDPRCLMAALTTVTS